MVQNNHFLSIKAFTVEYFLHAMMTISRLKWYTQKDNDSSQHLKQKMVENDAHAAEKSLLE